MKYPKLLFGLKSHKYLDTKFYPCRACKSEFCGDHKKSLQLDAKVIIGYFNFYLTTKFAIDDELYSFITDSPDTSPARIAHHLQKMACSYYFSDYQLFLHAAREEKIKSAPAQTVSKRDNQQPTITEALADQLKKTTAINRVHDDLARATCILKSQLESATSALDFSEDAPARNKLCFRRLMEQKRSHNSRDLPLPCIGISKLRQLVDLGMNNAVDLLRFEDESGVFYNRRSGNAKLNGWKAEADLYFEAKRKRRNDIAEQLASKEAELKAVDNWSTIKDVLAPVTDEEPDNGNVGRAEEEPKRLPPLFLRITDPFGYNANFCQQIKLILSKKQNSDTASLCKTPR